MRFRRSVFRSILQPDKRSSWTRNYRVSYRCNVNIDAGFLRLKLITFQHATNAPSLLTEPVTSFHELAIFARRAPRRTSPRTKWHLQLETGITACKQRRMRVRRPFRPTSTTRPKNVARRGRAGGTSCNKVSEKLSRPPGGDETKLAAFLGRSYHWKREGEGGTPLTNSNLIPCQGASANARGAARTSRSRGVLVPRTSVLPREVGRTLILALCKSNSTPENSNFFPRRGCPRSPRFHPRGFNTVATRVERSWIARPTGEEKRVTRNRSSTGDDSFAMRNLIGRLHRPGFRRVNVRCTSRPAPRGRRRDCLMFNSDFRGRKHELINAAGARLLGSNKPCRGALADVSVDGLIARRENRIACFPRALTEATTSRNNFRAANFDAAKEAARDVARCVSIF